MAKSKAHEPISEGGDAFQTACDKSGTIPTKRQLNKWGRKYGKAWQWHTVTRPRLEHEAAMQRVRELERRDELVAMRDSYIRDENEGYDPSIDILQPNGSTPREEAWAEDEPELHAELTVLLVKHPEE